MSGVRDNRERSPINQQDEFADAVEACLRPHQHLAASQKGNSALRDIALIVGATGFLVIATAGSYLAVKSLQTAKPASASLNEIAPISEELSTLQDTLAAVSDENRRLSEELDGLTGPGGVLSRVITQLQQGRQKDAAHSVAIGQLTQLIAQSTAVEAGLSEQQSATTSIQGLPVQVTPVRSIQSEQPRLVVVTPEPSVPTESKEEGQ